MRSNRRKPLPARPTAKPADAPLGSLASRAAARAIVEAGIKRIQVIVSLRQSAPDPDHPNPPPPPPKLDLAASTCHRSRTSASLIEVIALDGLASDINEVDFMRWVESHPIERHMAESR